VVKLKFHAKNYRFDLLIARARGDGGDPADGDAARELYIISLIALTLATRLDAKSAQRLRMRFVGWRLTTRRSPTRSRR
jgi:hypothetical protein